MAVYRAFLDADTRKTFLMIWRRLMRVSPSPPTSRTTHTALNACCSNNAKGVLLGDGIVFLTREVGFVLVMRECCGCHGRVAG